MNATVAPSVCGFDKVIIYTWKRMFRKFDNFFLFYGIVLFPSSSKRLFILLCLFVIFFYSACSILLFFMLPFDFVFECVIRCFRHQWNNKEKKSTTAETNAAAAQLRRWQMYVKVALKLTLCVFTRGFWIIKWCLYLE